MANILVIDDDKLILETIKAIISRTEHNYTLLNDSTKVATILEENQIDLLITDILMPELNGFDLLEMVQEKFSDIKVIVMSAGGAMERESYLGIAENKGANKTIKKPISAIKMLQYIDELTR